MPYSQPFHRTRGGVLMAVAMALTVVLGMFAFGAMVVHSRDQHGCPVFTNSSPSAPMGPECHPTF